MRDCRTPCRTTWRNTKFQPCVDFLQSPFHVTTSSTSSIPQQRSSDNESSETATTGCHWANLAHLQKMSSVTRADPSHLNVRLKEKGWHHCHPFSLKANHAESFTRTSSTHNSNTSDTHPSAPVPAYCTSRTVWRRAGSRSR